MMRNVFRGSARARWYGSLSFAVAGLGIAAADVAGNRSDHVPPTLILFLSIAAVLAFGGRSESVRAFRGDLSDERLRAIELRAVALAGRLTVLACVVGMIVEIARGHSGAPFTWLAAIGGFSYLAAWVYGMRR
jgi:hypothetical protein